MYDDIRYILSHIVVSHSMDIVLFSENINYYNIPVRDGL